MSKSSLGKPKTMTDAAADVRDAVRRDIAWVAGKRDWNTTRESWLAEAARKLGHPFGRIRSIWYDRRVRLSAAEYLSLKARVATLRAQHERLEAENARIRKALAGARSDRMGEGPDGQRGAGHRGDAQ
jgi:hypothetical protein